jgi:two-component system response regulator DevR
VASAGSEVVDMTTVAICDDHAMVRDALAGVISLYPDMDVVGVAESRATLHDVIEKTHPNVAVIDIRLGDESGIDAARDMQSLSPETKVIMLTSFSDDAYLVQAHDLGACAFVLKSGTPDELVATVRSVALGNMLIEDADVDAARERLKHRP